MSQSGGVISNLFILFLRFVVFCYAFFFRRFNNPPSCRLVVLVLSFSCLVSSFCFKFLYFVVFSNGNRIKLYFIPSFCRFANSGFVVLFISFRRFVYLIPPFCRLVYFLVLSFSF